MTDLHPNLKQLSHSSDVTLHRCPRRFELDKLSARNNDQDVHTRYGDIVGRGVQNYLISRNIQKTIFQMFMDWTGDIDDDSGLKDKKTLWHAMAAVERFTLLAKSVFGNFQLAYLNGRPAVELGFAIHIGAGFVYRGFIDAVMIDTLRQELVVLENKTTKYSNIHEAVYKNSGQSLGYSVVLDRISELLNFELGSSYKVYYPVYKTGAGEWEVFPFTKTHTSRALWIRQLMLDVEAIQSYSEAGFFPMYGESCYEYFRPCPHFGLCEMSNAALLLSPERVKERVEPEDKYDFHFTLEELVQNQLEKFS